MRCESVAAILYRVSLEPSYVGVMLAWRAKQVSRLRLLVLHLCGV